MSISFTVYPATEPRPAYLSAVESGPSRTWYPRAMKEFPMAPGAAHPRQTTGSGSQTTPQEKTSESRARDPILQVGSYVIEMFSVSRVHVWNIVVIGTYVCKLWSRIPLLIVTDERVHLWFYDRQGAIQSYGLNIILSRTSLTFSSSLRFNDSTWRVRIWAKFEL